MVLSKDLQPIHDLELSLGNRVRRIDEPAGTKCPYAVVFEDALHLEAIREQLQLPESVKFWESRDPHYELGNGYVCEITRHAVSGPIVDYPPNAP